MSNYEIIEKSKSYLDEIPEDVKKLLIRKSGKPIPPPIRIMRQGFFGEKHYANDYSTEDGKTIRVFL